MGLSRSLVLALLIAIGQRSLQCLLFTVDDSFSLIHFQMSEKFNICVGVEIHRLIPVFLFPFHVIKGINGKQNR